MTSPTSIPAAAPGCAARRACTRSGGQNTVVEQPDRPAGRRPLPAGRRAGLGKTLLVRSLGQALELQFRRVQFTRPDAQRHPRHRAAGRRPRHRPSPFPLPAGPDLHHLLLADELNRTPPKTQAALLEAMQERTVSYAGTTHALPAPFFVLATQNPIEQAGTYPLPEAQLDRFLLHVLVDYPSEDEERQILNRPPAVPPTRCRSDGCRSGDRTAGGRAPGACQPRCAAPGSPAWCQPAGRRRTGSDQPVGEVGRRSARRPVAGAGAKARALLQAGLPPPVRMCRRWPHR